MALPSPLEIEEATRTDVDWFPVPGFDDYDASSEGVLRRRSTRSLVKKQAGNKCQVRNNDGTWTTRSYSKLVNWAFDTQK